MGVTIELAAVNARVEPILFPNGTPGKLLRFDDPDTKLTILVPISNDAYDTIFGTASAGIVLARDLPPGISPPQSPNGGQQS